MTDIRFYYYDSSFYVAVVSDIFMAFDFHAEVPAEFERDFPREKIDSYRRKYFFISHAHSDHFTKKVFDFAGEGTTFIADECVPMPQGEAFVSVKKGDSYRDEDISVLVFGSTDEGASFGVEAAGKRIFHAGDLNLWHWQGENSPEEEAFARRFFDEELAAVKKGFFKPDYACFPVDSRMKGDYAEGADAFIRELQPGIFLPMHFWGDWSAPRAFAAKHKNCVLPGKFGYTKTE